MKILIINGSAHKGNTWRLAESVMEFGNSMDYNTEFEEIHLISEPLPFCTGCSSCFRLGREKCPHYAVVEKITAKIESSDGVVFLSSTYNMRETALLKNLFDHWCYMLHRPHFFQSKALVITTTGGVGGKKAAKSISSFLKGIGFNRCYLFSRAAFSWNAFEPNEKTLTALKRTVGSFMEDVSSGKLHSPSTTILLLYNLFRGMSLAYVKGTEYETMDGVFWTEKERAKAVYDPKIKVPFYKKPVGHLFYAIGKMGGRIKSMQVTYKK
ncbi:NAD(P)H-dependent oxidoreductase [Clostridiaceae bacterium OttesenSCG-928-D20]|nr:NAD(P)H-dependent oxidoreductase [Clostridiaceae bacterium OttesenSCG-928-D20]